MQFTCDVSCVVPVKNGGDYVGPCLESLLAQQFDGTFEVCIYNDGSTDQTEEIIESYREKFKGRGIEYRTNSGSPSKGVGYAKNEAVSMGQGRFLCFCDADDLSRVNRLQVLHSLALACPTPDSVFLGSCFERDPPGSTERFARWANGARADQLYNQIYTSHGPPLVAPTWFVARCLYCKVGGFNSEHPKGYPEDLDFFYRALRCGAVLDKSPFSLVVYRYHSGCETFSVKEETIWEMRLREVERRVLEGWKEFTIWSGGKQGKRLYKSLSPSLRAGVVAFCDVDARKVTRGVHEEFDAQARTVVARVPIVGIREAKPPLIICVKQDLTGGDLERFVAEKNLKEGADYVHFG